MKTIKKNVNLLLIIFILLFSIDVFAGRESEDPGGDIGGDSGGSAGNCNLGEMEGRSCGYCGTQTRTCQWSFNNDFWMWGYWWSDWGVCSGQGVCNPGSIESKNCGSNLGICEFGLETRQCQSNCQWSGFGSCIGGINPKNEECNGLDDDCDNFVDEGGNALCTDSSFCNGQETCQGYSGCQLGTPVSCVGNNIPNINTCNYIPDNNPRTLDYFPGFISQCVNQGNNSGYCTSGSIALTHSCNINSCGAECEDNYDCVNKCVGNVYYTNGGCREDCTCSYTTTNCDSFDGWYDTSNQRWVSTGQCTQKLQREQQYRNYFCGGSGCSFSAISARWVDIGGNLNKPDGTSCDDGRFCYLNDYCSGGICTGGSLRDCSMNNLNQINTCSNNPDNNPRTLDYFSGFTSVCDEVNDICTIGMLSLTHTCSIIECDAECDATHECSDNSCEETYNDYCDNYRLVEYDDDRVLDSTIIVEACSNDCLNDCSCTNCDVDCSMPLTNEYCVIDVCGAECEDNEDCDDNNDGTVDLCGGCLCVNTPVGECLIDDDCDDGLFCNGEEICNSEFICEDGELVDCSSSNLDIISMCNYIPDNNPRTLDYFPGFTSICDEVNDICTIGMLSLTHTCSVAECNAECEEEEDCEDLDCDDGCINYRFRECEDIQGSCVDCLCSLGVCPSLSECSLAGTDDDNDGYDRECGDCDDNDDEVYPDAEEICDNIDNDCDGEIDEGCDVCDEVNRISYSTRHTGDVILVDEFEEFDEENIDFFRGYIHNRNGNYFGSGSMNTRATVNGTRIIINVKFDVTEIIEQSCETITWRNSARGTYWVYGEGTSKLEFEYMDITYNLVSGEIDAIGIGNVNFELEDMIDRNFS